MAKSLSEKAAFCHRDTGDKAFFLAKYLLRVPINCIFAERSRRFAQKEVYDSRGKEDDKDDPRDRT